MVGYQEIISDPSYTNQTVVMTYPLIGNYGIADEDFETTALLHRRTYRKRIQRHPVKLPLHKTLSEILEENNIPRICPASTQER